MTELLKDSMISYICLVLIVTLFTALPLWGFIKHIVFKINRKKLKTLFSVIIITLYVCLLALLYINTVYPISLAYYENIKSITKDEYGIVNSISIDKDRIYVMINEKKYTVVYGSNKRDDNIMRNIKVGDAVLIKSGATSNFIFEIQNKDVE